jgi:hypothetical protein
LDKSHYLKPWTAKVTIEKLLRIMPTEEDETGQKLVSPIPWSEFEQIALDAKKAHTERFEEAGDVGTQAHEIIEIYIKNAIKHSNGIITDVAFHPMPDTDERVINCVNAALDWIEQHQVKFLKTEHKVYSRQWKYAGTMDASARVHACTRPECCPQDFHDELAVLDWKTSNQLSNDYVLQTAAYQNAEQEEFGETIKHRFILRLGKEDAKFEPWHLGPETFEMDFDGFKLCLALKRQMRYIEKRMSEHKKDRTAKKRAAKNAKRPASN